MCLKVATMPSAQSLSLLDFSFSDFDLSDTETTLGTIRMFVDLNLVQNFQMKYTVGNWPDMLSKVLYITGILENMWDSSFTLLEQEKQHLQKIQ